MSDRTVAIFMQDLAGGGAERAMCNLASGMVRRGVGVDMVLVRATGPYLRDLDPAVRVVDLKARRTYRSIGTLARYLRRERPAALLSGLVHVNIAAVAAARLARTGTRLCLSERNTASINGAHARLPLIRLAYRAAPWVYPRADRIIAVSEGVADDLARAASLPRGRIEVVHNPVATERIRSAAAEPVDHPWLAAGQPPLVLGVGRLDPQKDFATLLRAFAEVRRDRPARLMILGEGELRGELEALASEMNVAGDVALPGFAANPYACMSRAAAFVLPSRWEGLPNVLIEALACGAPVIATDCPGGSAEVLEGGRFGRLVPVGDAAAMADALRRMLDNPPNPASGRGRAEDFAVDRIAGRYLHVLLGGNGA